MYVCMYNVCIYVYVYVYVCIYMYIYIFIYIHKYTFNILKWVKVTTVDSENRAQAGQMPSCFKEYELNR